MPVTVVRTALQERLWSKAKQRATAQGHAHDWAYVMGIYQRMLGEPVEKAMLGAPQFAGWSLPGQLPRGQRDEQVERARGEAQDALRLAGTPPTQAAAERASSRPVLTAQAVVDNLGLDLAVSQRLANLVDGLSAGQVDELKFRQAWLACLVDGEPGLDPVVRQLLGERGLAFWRSRAEERRVPMAGELKITVPRERLAKAVLYIGPRGGRWANPQHTISWDDKIHGKPKIVLTDKTEEEEPKTAAVEPQQVLPADEQAALDEVAERSAVEGMLVTKRRQGKTLTSTTYGRATAAMLGKLFKRGLIEQRSPVEGEGFALTPAGEKLARRPAPSVPPVTVPVVTPGARTEMGELGKIANQVVTHVMSTPAGAKRQGFFLVGRYPAELGYERDDGTPLTEEETKQISEVGPGPHHRTRVWPTAEAARAAVEAAGGQVATMPPVTVPAGPAPVKSAQPELVLTPAKGKQAQLGLFSQATTAKVEEARARAQQVAKKAADMGQPAPEAALVLQEQAAGELRSRSVEADSAKVARRVRGAESVEEVRAEVGEHVWGSRKDLASLVATSADLAKLTPEEQSKVVTKARLVEPWEAEDLLTDGWEPEAVLARHAIESCIAPAAGDSLEARQAYMDGVDFLSRSFDDCRTFQDVREVLTDLNAMSSGKTELATYEVADMDALALRYAQHQAEQEGRTIAPAEQLQQARLTLRSAELMFNMASSALHPLVNEFYKNFWGEYVRERRSRASGMDFWENWVRKKPLSPELQAEKDRVDRLQQVKQQAEDEYNQLGGKLVDRARGKDAVAWAHGLPAGDVQEMTVRSPDGREISKFYQADPKLADPDKNPYQRMVASLGERMVRLVSSGVGGGGGWSSWSAKKAPKAWLDAMETGKRMHRPTERGKPVPTAEERVQLMHEHLKSKKRGGGKGGGARWLREVPEEVIRKGGRPVDLGSKSADLAADFGLKNVQFGLWVDTEDAQAHVPAARAAFADLQDLLGLEAGRQVSMGGRLALGIGARGKGNARAHYESQGEIINLTKIAGGGALAHEWAHALDNLLSKAGNPESTSASRWVSGGDSLGVDPRVARSFAHALAVIQGSQFGADAKVLGSRYWSRPHELFARAFEAWAEDELEGRGQQNSYLVAGTRVVYSTNKFVSVKAATKGEHAQPYPQGAARQQINQAIGELVQAIRETGALKKALEQLAGRRTGIFFNGRLVGLPGIYPAGDPVLTVPAGELRKAGGPFIGPKGGKWADAAHTISWKEPGAGGQSGVQVPAEEPNPETQPGTLAYEHNLKLTDALRHVQLKGAKYATWIGLQALTGLTEPEVREAARRRGLTKEKDTPAGRALQVVSGGKQQGVYHKPVVEESAAAPQPAQQPAQDVEVQARQRTAGMREQALQGARSVLIPAMNELLALRGLPPLKGEDPTQVEEATKSLWHGLQAARAGDAGAVAELNLRKNLHSLFAGLQSLYAVGDPDGEDARMWGKLAFTPKAWSALYRDQLRTVKDLLEAEKAKQQPTEKSLALLVPLDRLEKADPRGGKYVRRAPRPGGQGFRYYYSEKGYERATGHVDGQRATDQHVQGLVKGMLAKAGQAGLHPRRLADLVRRHGRQRVAGALKSTGCRLVKGRLVAGRAASRRARG